MANNRTRWLIPVVLLAIVGITGGLTAALWPEEEPEDEASDDTGLNRDQTEEFMRTIGYVQ